MTSSYFQNGTFKVVYPKVTIQGTQFECILIKNSAKKHFGCEAERIIEYIASSFHNRNIFVQVKSGGFPPYYKVASMTAGDPFQNPGPFPPWRDTCFRLHHETKTIEVFHCGPRKESEYDEYPDLMKNRLD